MTTETTSIRATRLGILRDLDITSLNLTDDERVELAAFAAEHGKELVG